MRKSSASSALAVAVLAILPGLAHAQADSVARRQQRTIDSLTAVVRQALARLDSASAVSAPVVPARTGAYMNIGFDGLIDAGWSSNPDVMSLQTGDHDPRVRGFTVPNAEITLDAVVDPYFKGFTNIAFKLDENGETGVELEEMFILTSALPRGLQLKAGQFFAEFGRQNTQHPHSWSFVDQPLVLGRMFGSEGLRSQGVRASWLLPTSFYTEAMLGVMNSAGGTTASFRSDESPELHFGVAFDRPVRGPMDLLLVPRLTTSIDLTESQTLLAGVSGAFGPNNAGLETRTAIFGADLYWKWKSLTAAQGFPFVSFQAEAMMRRYEMEARLTDGDFTWTLPAGTLEDKGGYAQVQWGVRPRLVLGLRGEAVSRGDSTLTHITLDRADRGRLSPNVTWYPTEFSKLRFQYNYDQREGDRRDHSLWLQFEFIMGAHAAHKF
jgi:hypothetical protein